MRMIKQAAMAATAAVAFMSVAGAAQALPPAMFVKKAGAGDLYEKRSSQIVLQSTHNPSIRRFANMMISDHTQSTMEVKSAAMKMGMHPMPPMLDPMQKRMIAQLERAHGRDRDRLYVDQQKMAHQQALALHQENAAMHGPLGNASEKIVPVIQHHIDVLKSMPM